MTNFMRAAINAKREYQGLEPLNTSEFMKLMREKRALVELDSKLARRSVNEGFSGGEKKRNQSFTCWSVFQIGQIYFVVNAHSA